MKRKLKFSYVLVYTSLESFSNHAFDYSKCIHIGCVKRLVTNLGERDLLYA